MVNARSSSFTLLIVSEFSILHFRDRVTSFNFGLRSSILFPLALQDFSLTPVYLVAFTIVVLLPTCRVAEDLSILQSDHTNERSHDNCVPGS